MRRAFLTIKKLAIFCHRWMGVAFCLLFLWWFVSGIFMMYWGYPQVTAEDRLARAPVLDASRVKLSAAEALAKLGSDQQPGAARLASFDGRPAYYFRFGRDQSIVYADTGEVQDDFPAELNLRTAANWVGQAPAAAKVEAIGEPDQWILEGRLRTLRPLNKYSFPDGQQVYIPGDTGEVAQYTTTSSRLFAYLGAIPHWLYFTPLRTNPKLWTQVVIWSSGLATVAALLGLTVGIWMYSPRKRYRHNDEASSIPYTGQKRLHTILGLFFGILACTWAFSGMLSMDPFPLDSGAASGGAGGGKGGGRTPVARIQSALSGGRLQLARFDARPPREMLQQLDAAYRVSGFQARQLEFVSFAGEPIAIATSAAASGRAASGSELVTRIVPLDGPPVGELDHARIATLVSLAVGPATIAESREIDQYDRYYLDRDRQRPLPVIYIRLKDEGNSRLYIDPKSGRIVERYSDSTAAWVERWLYHGLHSMNFPLLYNHRPAWDVVVLSLMLLCTWLCVTSVILGWRVLKRVAVR